MHHFPQKETNTQEQMVPFSRSCMSGMRSLFDLVHGVVKPRSDRKAWCLEKPDPAPWAKGDPPLASPNEPEVSRRSNKPGLARLLTFFVRQATSVFDTDLALVKAGTTAARVSTTERKSWGKERGIRDPVALRCKCLWALWVLETLLSLETGKRETGEAPRGGPDDGDGASSRPILAASEENDDASEESAEAASARSPQVFAAALRAAISEDLDEPVRALACSLCSVMLSLSRPARPNFSGGSSSECREARAAAENSGAHRRSRVIRSVPPEDGYELPLQEHSLARAFSSGLRNQAATPSLSSRLLQGQLELLAQWELRRSTGKTGRGLHPQSTHRQGEDVWDRKDAKISGENPSSPVVRINDSWDVATALFAGLEAGGGDGFETTQARSSRTTAARRTGTSDVEASTPSSSPSPCLLGEVTPNHESLLVEAVSATSVTVSWGGWFETDDEPELQVGLGSGDCLPRPSAFGKVPGTSDLAQAVRSRLKHAASRQQDEEGPSLVLKVRGQRGRVPTLDSESFDAESPPFQSRLCLLLDLNR